MPTSKKILKGIEANVTNEKAFNELLKQLEIINKAFNDFSDLRNKYWNDPDFINMIK